ncbi:MAG: hypothetical protein GY888_05160, partial [Planctomycetaceae bacterium]|nr:hypothetical protein [Planctomycetaceae bacterium]
MSPVRSAISLLITATAISLALTLLTLLISGDLLGTFLAMLMLALTVAPTAILSMIGNMTLCSEKIALRPRRPAIASMILFLVAFLTLLALGIMDDEENQVATRFLRHGALTMVAISHLVFLVSLQRLLPADVVTPALLKTRIAVVICALLSLLTWTPLLSFDSPVTRFLLALATTGW